MTSQYLEWREKQYDVRETVDVFGANDDSVPVVPGAWSSASAVQLRSESHGHRNCVLLQSGDPCAHLLHSTLSDI